MTCDDGGWPQAFDDLYGKVGDEGAMWIAVLYMSLGDLEAPVGQAAGSGFYHQR